jgi:hypothetical protein
MSTCHRLLGNPLFLPSLLLARPTEVTKRAVCTILATLGVGKSARLAVAGTVPCRAHGRQLWRAKLWKPTKDIAQKKYFAADLGLRAAIQTQANIGPFCCCCDGRHIGPFTHFNVFTGTLFNNVVNRKASVGPFADFNVCAGTLFNNLVKRWAPSYWA